MRKKKKKLLSARSEDRTHDLWIMRPTLYQLSHSSSKNVKQYKLIIYIMIFKKIKNNFFFFSS